MTVFIIAIIGEKTNSQQKRYIFKKHYTFIYTMLYYIGLNNMLQKNFEYEKISTIYC